MIQPTLLLKDPTETLTCVPGPNDLLGRLRGVSVAIQGAHILDVAPYPVLAERYDLSQTQIIDVRGKILVPGFVDSHTHVVFGGSRVQEYAARMTRTPAEVRALGLPTGITATMVMTRAATEDELVASAAARLHRMLLAGTTTVESKSGYGLSLEHELKMLRVNQRLKHAPPPSTTGGRWVVSVSEPPPPSAQGASESVGTQNLDRSGPLSAAQPFPSASGKRVGSDSEPPPPSAQGASESVGTQNLERSGNLPDSLSYSSPAQSKDAASNSLPLPDILSTFLGAHAFPPDKSHAAYMDEILYDMLPAVKAENLAEFCDVYIDDGYFTLPQTRRILETARDMGFKLKIHADQYGALGGSELAAELGVVSADHLNYTTPETMRSLADAGVVGVLMPLIDFAVQHPRPFDARAMLDAGMMLALATDICPGGWTESMQLVMQFACRQHRLSPEEALYAATVGGARALALPDRGALAPGLRADIQIWDVGTFEEVIYRLGGNVVEGVVLQGKLVIHKHPIDPRLGWAEAFQKMAGSEMDWEDDEFSGMDWGEVQ